MNYRFLLLFVFLFSCTVEKVVDIPKQSQFKKPFSKTGFALIYSEDLNKQKIISKSIDNRSMIIFQKNLKKNTFVKITNLNNDKSIIVSVGGNANYPEFYNAVISQRISDELELNAEQPYVNIKEIHGTSTFIANKAKTFEEERNVAEKAPVDDITIKSIGISDNKKITKKTNNEFSYIIKIADLYFLDSAEQLKNRIKKDTKVKKINIEKMTKTKYRVYLGPFKSLNSLKKSFNDISVLNFENLEILNL
tara:strand:+ start:34 stop:783 length:750 start_codon:yes stop_codon:yes gene_type:complete